MMVKGHPRVLHVPPASTLPLVKHRVQTVTLDTTVQKGRPKQIRIKTSVQREHMRLQAPRSV